MEHENDGDTTSNWRIRYIHQKGLKDFEIRGRVKTSQITALLRSVRILGKVQETWEDLLSLKLQRETIS